MDATGRMGRWRPGYGVFRSGARPQDSKQRCPSHRVAAEHCMSMPDTSPAALARSLPATLRGPAELIIDHLQHGTFQRSLALLVAGTSIVSGKAMERWKDRK